MDSNAESDADKMVGQLIRPTYEKFTDDVIEDTADANLVNKEDTKDQEIKSTESVIHTDTTSSQVVLKRKSGEKCEEIVEKAIITTQSGSTVVNFGPDELNDDFAEPFDDEESKTNRELRKTMIDRDIHNQKAYYDQKNNVESDASDILSDCSSTDEFVSFDKRMKEMVNMFNRSFVPYGLLHSSFFVNLLRSSFNLRKMPKLCQMRDFFYIMYELGTKYIKQTVSGSQSYTIAFEFWKSANKRHQYITVRVSYIDVFHRRAPALSCFKVFHDWSSDRYIEKFNYIFKRFKLDRNKVFAVVTNLKAKEFVNALDIYIGSQKVIYCLVGQLNGKFNEVFLNCDYEEDKIHYQEPLKELDSEVENLIEENTATVENTDNNNDDNYDRDYSDNECDFSEDGDESNYGDSNQVDQQPSEDVKLVNESEGDDLYETDKEELEGKLAAQTEEDEEETDFELEDETIAYVKLKEEAIDVFKALRKQKINEMPPTVRVVKSLLKSFAFIASNEKLLAELNNLTVAKNGQEFYLYFLLAYKNYSYLHKFLFYFKETKEIVVDFCKSKSQIPYDLNENDLKIIDDLFEILACIMKKMNLLSLEDDISLGRSLNIYKFFINTLSKLLLKTEEGRKLKYSLVDFFKRRHGVFERDDFYSIASLLDPKSTKYDFKTDQNYGKAISKLYDLLCYRLDKDFNIALYRIRLPLKLEVENFHRNRPYKGVNCITKFQLNSPVLQDLVYDYFTVPAICFEPKKIDYEVRDEIIDAMSQVRGDQISKVVLLNSLNGDVFDRVIDCAKFW